jgi:hypothetical protein
MRRQLVVNRFPKSGRNIDTLSSSSPANKTFLEADNEAVVAKLTRKPS